MGTDPSYKWRLNPYKWPYKLVTGVITSRSGVISPCLQLEAEPFLSGSTAFLFSICQNQLSKIQHGVVHGEIQKALLEALCKVSFHGFSNSTAQSGPLAQSCILLTNLILEMKCVVDRGGKPLDSLAYSCGAEDFIGQAIMLRRRQSVQWQWPAKSEWFSCT